MSINETLLRSFCDLKKEEKEVKKRVEEMKVRVLQELQTAGADEVAISDMGKLVVVPKRTWKYPDSVVKMQEDLKKAEKDSIARGDATFTETPFVRFDSLEEKNNQE